LHLPFLVSVSIDYPIGYDSSIRHGTPSVTIPLGWYRGWNRGESNRSTGLGQANLHQGRYDDAQTQAKWIAAEARDPGYNRGITLGLALLGEVALVAGAFAQAERVLADSVEAAGLDAKDPYEQGQLATLGLAKRGFGRHLEAKQQILSALSRAGSTSDFMGQMVALVGLALLCADEGEAERAIELFSLASRHRFVANSLWFQDIVGSTITEAAAELPPGMLRAARERGAALDLGDTIESALMDHGS
jgi:hypothetical protein